MKKSTLTPQQVDKLYDKLYEKYGKPLEENHWGDYLAVSQKGETIVGRDRLGVAKKAFTTFGPGSFLYKVGEKAIGKWLTII